MDMGEELSYSIIFEHTIPEYFGVQQNIFGIFHVFIQGKKIK